MSLITTPFGRGQLSLGQIAGQIAAQAVISQASQPGSNQPAAVNKWQLFRTLTEIRERLGVSDRALSVLNALLSFQQETALTLPKAPADGQDNASDAAGEDSQPRPSCDLVVFPSNKALTLRAHGMADTTLRRHLAMLVEAGLIFRRDSPNGKRYARKDQSGRERFSDAFGFDLTTLVTRAPEFEAMAEAQRLARKTGALLRERISLHRRDVGRLIACALDDGLAQDLPGVWESYRQRFMALMTPLRRLRDTAALEALGAALSALRQDVAMTLEEQLKSKNMAGNASQNDWHQSNSNTEAFIDFEPPPEGEGDVSGCARHYADVDEDAHCFSEGAASLESKQSGLARIGAGPEPDPLTQKGYALGLVMEACPDVNDYKFDGGRVRSWPEFLATLRQIRPMLGISPSAWDDARDALGEVDAHIVLATILQRSEHSSQAQSVPGEKPGTTASTVNGSPAIKSAGGYLRALTEKARAGEFALGPVLMALIGQRSKVKRGRGTAAFDKTGI